jgi:hypothetical protein
MSVRIVAFALVLAFGIGLAIFLASRTTHSVKPSHGDPAPARRLSVEVSDVRQMPR